MEINFFLLFQVLLIVFFLSMDPLLSLFYFGFYHTSWSFSMHTLIEKLLCKNGYNFLTSPLDFLLLAICRSLLVIICLFTTIINRKFWPPLFFIGIQICNFSYSFIKLLALSDLNYQLQYIGLWLNIVHNLISFIPVHIICQLFAKSILQEISARNGAYQTFVEENGTSDHFDENHSEFIGDRYQQQRETLVHDRTSFPTTFNHILRLLKYCMHYWTWITIGFTFLIIYSTARVFIPLCMAKVISAIVHKDEISKFTRSIFLMISLVLVATVFGGLRAGTLVSTNLNIFLRNGVMAVGALVFMTYYSWRLTMITFIALPPIAFFTKLYSTYYDFLGRRTQELVAESNRVAEEVISSMRTVRSFACESKEQERYEDHLSSTLAIHKKKSYALCGFNWITEFSNNLILIGVLFYGGYLVLSEKMTEDGIIAFLLYQLQLGENFYNLNSVITGLMESVGASRKVFEYMDRSTQVRNDGQLKTKISGKIEFVDVSFSYPTRPSQIVLHNISFAVTRGETVAFVGPSGAGKSSLISLLERFYLPNVGRILIDDTDINEFEHRYFHEKIALVSQEPILFAGSIRDNILYGCSNSAEITDDEMMGVAKQANVHDFVSKMDQGYNTLCGEKGIQMSGGQKQRIAIARALMRDPSVLILDEATSALDAESEHIVQEAIGRCSLGRTVLVIAHRLSTVEQADRIIVMNHGIIVQIGTHSQLMGNQEGLYYTLVQRQLFSESHTE